MRGLKQLTSKPVVGVGRFTSPDTMVRMIRSGVLDLIGAARPSIADPFLPKKIEEGRLEDIRECIGCNICVSGDFTMSPIRCTQNPTMGEEWRRGWHPERIRPRTTRREGAGRRRRAGRARGGAGAGQARLRGDAGRGRRRVRRPGRARGAAARDGELDPRASTTAWPSCKRLRNVERAESRGDADEILDYGFEHVAVATGARWRADGVGRFHTQSDRARPGAAGAHPRRADGAAHCPTASGW